MTAITNHYDLTHGLSLIAERNRLVTNYQGKTVPGGRVLVGTPEPHLANFLSIYGRMTPAMVLHGIGARFVHDCEGCEFLGGVEIMGMSRPDVDLYACPSDTFRGGPSLIYRYSDEGQDYGSLDATSAREFIKGRKYDEHTLVWQALLARWAWMQPVIAHNTRIADFRARVTPVLECH